MQISRSQLDRLHAIVAADPVREVCGLLLGSDGVVDAIVEAANVAPDPQMMFEIDPRVLIAARKAERAGGARIVGCYHSHPSGMARPSRWDREMSQPNDVWLIFAGADVTAWLRGTDEFQQLGLEVR